MALGNRNTRERVGSLIGLNSQILSIEHENFSDALAGRASTEVFCFYETEESTIAYIVSPSP